MSEPIDLVSAALVACQGELKAAGFDSTNPFLRNRYASLGAVIECSRISLAKNGLAVQQIPSTGDTNVSVHTVIRHKSGQFLDGGLLTMPIGEEKGKSRAQVTGSLITYLKRYAWASNLGIYADEDNDGNEPESSQSNRGVSGHPPEAKNASQSQPEGQSTTLAAPKELPPATPESRMRALNKLNAAAGQINRPLIEHFLLSKKWITLDQQPEDWPLEYVPRSQKQFEALVEEVRLFELRMLAQPEGGTE